MRLMPVRTSSWSSTISLVIIRVTCRQVETCCTVSLYSATFVARSFTMPTIKWISTSQQLEKLCQSWLQQDFIALDTEFVRERTYYPQPGLVQVGCSEGI